MAIQLICRQLAVKVERVDPATLAEMVEAAESAARAASARQELRAGLLWAEVQFSSAV